MFTFSEVETLHVNTTDVNALSVFKNYFITKGLITKTKQHVKDNDENFRGATSFRHPRNVTH